MFSTQLVNELSAKLEAITGSLYFFIPEMILISGFLSLLIFDLIGKRKSWLSLCLLGSLWIGLCLLANCWLFVDFQGVKPKGLFLEMLILDRASMGFKYLFLLAGLVTLWISRYSKLFRRASGPWGEYFALIFSVLLGAHLMVMSANLLTIYISIELVSISSYLLTALPFDRKSAEGSLKYLLFGAISSAIMLYGMSWLYGLSGTLHIYDPAFGQMLSNASSLPVFLGLLLSVGGLFFKISAVPFHVWTPDVYEAAPTPIVAFFSIVPKLAGIWILFRISGIFTEAFHWGNNNFYWTEVLALIALITITFGNFSALWQENGKRLLAYSSIAHAGFLLVPLVAATNSASQNLMFYATIYLFMNFAAFLLLEMLANYTPFAEKYDLRSYQGLGLAYPWLGASALLIMIALTGLPPTAGFTAKLLIFSSLWEAYSAQPNQLMLILFVFGLLNTAVSLFFYLKLPYYMFFKTPQESTWEGALPSFKLYDRICLLILIIPLLLFFFKANWLVTWIEMVF